MYKMNNNYNIFNRRLKRKSQVTLAIIAGIMIVLIIAAIFYIREYVIREKIAGGHLTSEEFEKDTLAIQNYVEDCVRDVGYNGLVLLGKQGGYIDVPNPVRYEDTSILYLDSINIQPSLNQTKKWLMRYVDENVKKCSNFDIFRERGFKIVDGDVESWVDYSDTTVRLDVNYPITMKREGNEKKIDSFVVDYDIRYRRVFELASQIINRVMTSEFRFSKPLELVNKSDFEVDYRAIGSDSLIFTITDPYAYESGIYYKFDFAAKFGRPYLPRTVYLQGRSSQVGIDLPFIIYSPDRLAQLMLMPGVTVNLDGNDVDEITVDQHYPDKVIRGHVVFHETASDSFVYDDINYVTTNPVYQFEPTGLKFSDPSRMVIYWNEEENPHGDENVGIIYDEGEGWRPLQVKANYDESYAYTDIDGFSNYSLVYCADQEEKTKSATAKIDPGSGCWVKLIIMIVLIIVLWYMIVMSGGGAPLVAESALTEGMVITGTPTQMWALQTGLNQAFIPYTLNAAGTALTVGAIPASAGVVTAGAIGATGMTAAAAGSLTASGLAAASGGFLSSMGAAFSAALQTVALGAGSLTMGGGLFVMGLGMKLALIGAVVGGMYLSASQSDAGAQDTVTFTPTCNQEINIEKSGNGKGTCMPQEGTMNATAGQPVSVTAMIKECPDGKKYACGKCTLTCTVKYK